MKPLLFLTLVLVLAGCGRSKPETLAGGDYDHAAMDAAIARARAETDVFLKALAARDGEDFSVKAPITDPNGTEHFWIVDIAYADGVFQGKVGNEPGIVENVTFGQAWTIRREEISDWMYLKAGRIHGGYTIDPLLATMPKEQADAMRQRLVR